LEAGNTGVSTAGVSIAVIDHFDSFTYTVAYYLEASGAQTQVLASNAVTADTLSSRQFAGVVISPGPGKAEHATRSLEIVRNLDVPILGVCLGHQVIAVAAGASVVPAPRIIHGKTSTIAHDGVGVFAGLRPTFEAMRYHSWVVDERTLPPELVVSAYCEGDVVMGIRHRSKPIEGIQFHPESFQTQEGLRLLENFVDLCRRRLL